ncbi:MAG TPA: DnaJ domain-containing protein, partial [Gammaproteobacteria bacterium]
MHDILQLALNFHQSPSEHKDLTDPARPLPGNIDLLLEIAAGEVESSAISGEVTPAENISRELLVAATYFVEHALFIPKGNHYRTLGVEVDANPEQIRKHYHLLLKLLYLDREDKSAEWNTSYAMRINHAYSILRDPVKRRSYDQILSKQGIRIVKGDKHYDKESISSGPPPSTTRPALADIITTHKEGDLSKKTDVLDSRPVNPPVPESKPSKAPFIAGNINKAQGAAGGQEKAVTTDSVKKIDKGNKETGASPLASQEFDSFQQVIKARPGMGDRFVGPMKNYPAHYRTVTVALSALLLAVVVIYVFQRGGDEADIVTEVVQSGPADSGNDASGNVPVLPPSPAADGSTVSAPAEDKTVKTTARLGEVSPVVADAMPAGSDIETRRRRTIDDVPARNLTGNISTRPRSSDGVRTGEKAAVSSTTGITATGITSAAPKAPSSLPERRLPTKAVTESKATSTTIIAPGQNKTGRPTVTEKPVAKPSTQNLPDKQAAPEVTGNRVR